MASLDPVGVRQAADNWNAQLALRLFLISEIRERKPKIKIRVGMTNFLSAALSHILSSLLLSELSELPIGVSL
jgi:hypothetical protein